MTFAIRNLLDIVGTAELHCYRGTWTLRKAYVPPYARGRGYHKRLIRMRLRVARRKGAQRVIAWVNPRNAASLNGLVACGFRFVKRAPRRFGGVEHVMLQRRFD